MMVSLPPLDLKTMRWAEPRAEMSIVSSPASPSMVMVLRRRLVPEKSPMTAKVSPAPRAAVPGGSTPLMRISSISESSAMTVATVRAVAGDDDLRRAPREAARASLPATASHARQRVDAVGFGGRRCR